MEFLLIPVVFCLAGIVQGATGFGFGLVVVATLGAFTDIKDASITVTLAALGLNLTMLWRLRAHVRLRGVAPLMIGSAVAIPFGVWFLAESDPRAFSVLVGLVLLAAAASGLSGRMRGRPWHPVWVGAPMGVLAGLLSGAFGTGGPPVVAYVASQGYDRFRYAATVQVVLAMNSVLRGGELFRQGLMTPRLFWLSLVGTAGVALGGLLGLRVLHGFTDERLRRVVVAMLFVLALRCFSVLIL